MHRPHRPLLPAPATTRTPIQPAPNTATTRANCPHRPNTGPHTMHGRAPATIARAYPRTATIGAHGHTGHNWHTIAHRHPFAHTIRAPIPAHTKPAPVTRYSRKPAQRYPRTVGAQWRTGSPATKKPALGGLPVTFDRNKLRTGRT